MHLTPYLAKTYTYINQTSYDTIRRRKKKRDFNLPNKNYEIERNTICEHFHELTKQRLKLVSMHPRQVRNPVQGYGKH